MTTQEKVARKRIRKNFKAQVDDLVLYCKVNIEVLGGVMPGQNGLTEPAAKMEAFKAVLKRLGVE